MCDRCKKETAVRTGVKFGGCNGPTYWLCNDCLVAVKRFIELDYGAVIQGAMSEIESGSPHHAHGMLSTLVEE